MKVLTLKDKDGVEVAHILGSIAEEYSEALDGKSELSPEDVVEKHDIFANYNYDSLSISESKAEQFAEASIARHEDGAKASKKAENASE
jgi:hypothetical protein